MSLSSDISEAGLQRFVISPGSITEPNVLQTLTSSAGIGQSGGLSLSSLQPGSPSGFGPDLTGALGTSAIFDNNENNK